MNSLFYYIETVLRGLPEAIYYLRARTPEGFREASERLLVRAIEHLERSANHLRNASEDTITIAAIGFLNGYGICASCQTNSRGHVDLYIRHSWQTGLMICGEAKIWNGAAYHIGGMNQVLKYTTGRYPYCFMLEYVRVGAVANHMQTLRDRLDAQRPEQQNAACAAHPHIQWGLLSDHIHDSGGIVTMLHAGVNLVG